MTWMSNIAKISVTKKFRMREARKRGEEVVLVPGEQVR